jgi:hypothetical protein
MDVGTRQYTNLIKGIGIGALSIKEQKGSLNVIQQLPQKW